MLKGEDKYAGMKLVPLRDLLVHNGVPILLGVRLCNVLSPPLISLSVVGKY